MPAARTGAAMIGALAALALAATPWAGAWLTAVDRLAPAWPLAPVLAVAVLVLARGRGAAAIGSVAALVLCVPTILAQPAPAATPQAGFRLRVVTHNVWVHNADPAGTAAVLVGSGADILLLQETNGRFAAMLPRLLRSFPYATRCPRRCPLMILSRYPIERVGRRDPGRLWAWIDPGMMTDVRIRLPGDAGTVPVATVHLARGQSPAADLRQRAGLAQAMRRADGAALILAGDFNLVPWSSRLRALDASLAPLSRATAVFSWPARISGPVPLPIVPIDHLYAGPGWQLATLKRLERTGSDHYPIAVDLIWQGREAMVTMLR